MDKHHQLSAETPKKVINFMGMRRISAAFSILLLVISVASLGVRGLNFGLDFTGGALVEVAYSQPEPIGEIRQLLRDNGFEQITVVNFGADTDVLVRLPLGYEADVGERIVAILESATAAEIDLRRVEFVGPQVGEDLRDQGGIALLLALGVVLIYVAMRFQLKFALGAVVALIHDVVIVVGVFSVIGWQFDLSTLAALLAVIGYSLNDTIVVSDRIRENFRKLRKLSPMDTINISLTETLDRTLITSLTTALVLVTLVFLGGDSLWGFAMALLIGVLVGTYSSIYVAANVLMELKISKEDLIIPEQENDNTREDGLP